MLTGSRRVGLVSGGSVVVGVPVVRLSPSPWRVLLALLLAAVAAAGLLYWAPWAARSALPSPSASARALPHRDGLLSLPLVSQGPVSAGLGGDEPAYRVHDLIAGNPVQRLRSAFSSGGVSVVSGGARMGMRLAGFGYEGAVRPLGTSIPRVRANRVSYSYRSVREWFANGPLGLEQGFDVQARPHGGSGPLTFSLGLSGNLRPVLRGGSLLLSGHGANLAYRGLVATDARGRILHSFLQLQGDRLLVRVDDRDAVYPIRVDPFVQQAELTASDGETGDSLGYSIAISGSTIVAGAPIHQVGSNIGEGAAYVFVMPASGWANATQTAELTASNGAARIRLGYSIAISGSTIVAGALAQAVGLNTEQGAAYVFVMPASGWTNATQTAELTASDGRSNDNLGASVAVSGGTIVASAPNHMVGSNLAQGALYVFVALPSGWANATQTAELTASEPSWV